MRNFSQIDDLRYSQQSYQLRGLLFDVRNRLRAGWPEEIYHEGIVQAAKERGIPTCSKPRRTIVHRGVEIHTNYTSDHLLVQGDWLLGIRGLLEYPPSYDFARMKTYLNSLNLKFGLIANFGKKQLQIYGVNAA